MFGTLPLEVIDNILGWVDKRRDLLNFACASRTYKALAIPRHTEYRVLRVAGGIHWQRKINPGCINVWTHLTRFPSLTSNIRTLHFITEGYQDDYLGCMLRIPTQLVQKVDEAEDQFPTSASTVNAETSTEWGEAEVKEQFDAVCAAVKMMDKLDTFMWSLVCFTDPKTIFGRNDLLLELVAQKSSLRRLELADPRAIQGLLDSFRDPRHSIWQMAHLQGLEIGYSWGGGLEPYEPVVIHDVYFAPWIQTLSSLTYLEISQEVFAAHSAKFHLPSLKRLSLVGHRAVNPSRNDHLGTFFVNHPQIEEFSWSPWTTVYISLLPGCLPNLRRVSCPQEFLSALDVATWVVGPFSAPRKLVELTLDSGYARYNARNRIEGLLLSRAFDHQRCLRLRGQAAASMAVLFGFPNEFPNVTHLSLTCSLDNPDSNSSKTISQDEWVQLLSKFRNLEVFNGDGIWGEGGTFDHIPEASDPLVVQVVQRFTRCCPKLRQIICPVVFILPPSGALDHRNQKIVIWREDAGTDAGSRVMAKWLGVHDDRAKRWNVKWKIVEPVRRDTFGTAFWEEVD